jgi:hypothetical protein
LKCWFPVDKEETMQNRFRLIASVLLVALGVVTIAALAKNRATTVAETAKQETTQLIAPTTGQAITTDTPEPSESPSPSSQSAATYEINWQSINGGGEDMLSPTYEMQSSIGQSAIGAATSSSYELGAGYWYGVGSGPPPPCGCPCHADPQCDGVTNVLDVVQTVNVAFRGQASQTDVGCGYQQTDVDCDAVTNVLDVVKVVNVAFRGALPSANFCDPCP